MTTPAPVPARRAGGFSLHHVLASLVFVTLSAVSPLGAQSAAGAIAGRVFNASSGAALRNAVVTIEGSGQEVTTDDEGHYLVPDVPVGTVRLKVQYLGFAPQVASVDVPPGRTATRDFELVLATGDETVKLAAFTVVADREMSAQAVSLNERRTAPNIKNVVAYDEYGDRSGENIGEFLRFLPGVGIDEGGGQLAQNITLRGFPDTHSVINIDGAHVATARGAGRANSLFDIPTANISRVEITKVPTPDMPASGLGGTVNIIKKSGLESRKRAFSYRIYHIIDDRDGLTIDGGPRGLAEDFDVSLQPMSLEFTGVVPVNRSFGLSFGASNTWRRNPLERDDYLDTAGQWNFVQGFQRLSTWQSVDQIFRTWNFQLGADWRISDRDTLSANVQHRGIHNNIMRVNFEVNYGAGATGDRTFTQGSPAGNGTITQADGDNGDSGADTTHATLKYGHRGDAWRVEALGAFSASRSFAGDIDNGYFNTVPSTLTGLVIRGEGIGEDGRNIPVRYSATRAGVPVDIFEGGNYALGNPTSAQQGTRSRNMTGRLDFTREFGGAAPFALKTGVYGQRMTRDRRAHNRTWAFQPNGQTSANARLARNFDVFDAEFLPTAPRIYGREMSWISNVKMFDLYRQHPDWFVLNEAQYHQNLVNASTNLTETVSASYLRGDVRLLDRRLWVVGGIRYERTNDEGEGPLNDPSAQYVKDAAGNLVLAPNGQPTLITTDALARARLRYLERGSRTERSYGGWYPSLNVSYNVREDLVLRAAYARTIGRPDIGFILPGVTISEPTAADPVINVNNTGLKPWTADGYDLSIETYQIKGGFGSVGVFQKDIRDFFGSMTMDATPELLAQYGAPADPLYLNYDIRTRTNAGDARIRGFEFSYTQSLFFLPHWARGLQVFVNGTKLDLSGSATADFENYSPSQYAGGINFVRPRYYVKLTFTYQGEAQRGQVSPNVNNGIPPGTYDYQSERLRIGLNAQYSFTRKFAVFGSINNLHGRGFVIDNRRYPADAPEFMKMRRQQQLGATVMFGVKGDF